MYEAPNSATRRKLVMIVDDVEDNRALLDRFLTNGGYATVLCDSGTSALAAIDRQRPDIILLDWMMPGLTGIETLRAIREKYDVLQLPVIMCTALDEEASVVSAISSGANDFITKPISIPILKARMTMHLDQVAANRSLHQQQQNAQRELSERTRALFQSMNNNRNAQ